MCVLAFTFPKHFIICVFCSVFGPNCYGKVGASRSVSRGPSSMCGWVNERVRACVHKREKGKMGEGLFKE